MDLADLVLLLLTVVMLTLLTLGIASRNRPLALNVLLALCAWLALTMLLSTKGLLAFGEGPPRWALIPVLAVTAAVLLARTTTLVTSIPPWWPVALQTFRVAVELTLYFLFVAGRAPEQITFAGRNFDIVVGLSAPVMAVLVARHRVGPRLVFLWNALGLGVLACTVAVIASSAPGPLHLDWPGRALTAVADWPTVWLPAFLMPTAVFLHVFSGRQALRSRAISARA